MISVCTTRSFSTRGLNYVNVQYNDISKLCMYTLDIEIIFVVLSVNWIRFTAQYILDWHL